MKRNRALQAAILVAAGVILALVANAFASRDRKLSLVGWYPNALKVPPREAVMSTPSASPVTVVPNPQATTTVAPVAPSTSTAATTTALPPATATAAIETVGTKPVTKPSGSTPPATASSAPADAPVPNATPEDASKRFTPHPDKAYVEITFNDVKWLHDHNALFLDARRTSVYEQGHIAGARPYSVWESDLDDKVNKLFAERGDPSEQSLPIVVYCSGGECEDSHMLAQKLWGIQFNNVYVYKDGFPDWQQHGGATHTGANP